MKNLRYIPFSLKVICITIFMLTACVTDDESLEDVSDVHLEYVGEGGIEVVDLGAEGWKIMSIESLDGMHRLFGDAFDLNDEILLENRLLALDGLGYVVFTGSKVGFEIRHETPGVFEIMLNENASGQHFGFIVTLKNENQNRRIFVDQEVSAGYQFEQIEFYLGENDEDSLYIRNDLFRYYFDFLEPRQVEVSPFNGVDVLINSYFESDSPDAFVWFESESIEVEVPSEIHEGNIYFSGVQSNYSKEPATAPYLSNQLTTLDAPAGNSVFSTSIEMRKRKVSYKLTIKSKSTSEIKEIEGRWIEISPTGMYQIDEIVED
ncbi:hypothetical protein MM239_04030 [Belliella sp. DSM 111904]|uniref:DUF4382 domain-containing protein n=1 Tax=Belliella filtrata TaxID=2923435 RepID=A0ABS9UXV7_9BACT|nr:hypothetical protein [Belliella filtrata]MCH7408550.1 hypothetical protein [Belliella filtrata]